MVGRKKHRNPRIAIPYTPTPRSLPSEDVEYDKDKALEILKESLIKTQSLPVTGKCYRCGRKISGERRFCGSCVVIKYQEKSHD